MKRSFFQAVVVSILLYGCTTWTLTKLLEKKLDGNYTRMLRAILNKSWRQHPTRHQLYDHLPPISKTIHVRRARHAGHCWRSNDELTSDVLLWTSTYGQPKAGRSARTYLQQLCEDTGCNPEDLPEAMNDREKWRERVRDIRAGGTTWWWWWSLPGSFLHVFSDHNEIPKVFLVISSVIKVPCVLWLALATYIQPTFQLAPLSQYMKLCLCMKRCMELCISTYRNNQKLQLSTRLEQLITPTASLQWNTTLSARILDMTLNHLTRRLRPWRSGNVEYFIAVTPSLTLTWRGRSY